MHVTYLVNQPINQSINQPTNIYILGSLLQPKPDQKVQHNEIKNNSYSKIAFKLQKDWNKKSTALSGNLLVYHEFFE